MCEILKNVKQIIIASTNNGKISQIKEFDFFRRFEILTLNEVNIGDVEETEDTLEGNAILKARNCFNSTNLPSLSDDTGFFVTALDGFPGIHCGRLAGPTGNRDFHKAASIINEKLKNSTDRSCIFVSVIVFIIDGIEFIAKGSMPGTFIYPAMMGNCTQNGGYNPYFIPENSTYTYAQMGIQSQETISHRSIALQNLVQQLKNYSV